MPVMKVLFFLAPLFHDFPRTPMATAGANRVVEWEEEGGGRREEEERRREEGGGGQWRPQES